MPPVPQQQPTLSADHLRIIDGPVTDNWLTPMMISDPTCGAISSFIGVVRNEHHGRAVTAIDYQCYADMALKLLAEWVAHARQQWSPLLRASIAHATGHTVPGDVAVAIHVATPHRAAANAACHYFIETIKQDLPVWKHEHYADGASAWLPGS